jgi:hypothetical protein
MERTRLFLVECSASNAKLIFSTIFLYCIALSMPGAKLAAN